MGKAFATSMGGLVHLKVRLGNERFSHHTVFGISMLHMYVATSYFQNFCVKCYLPLTVCIIIQLVFTNQIKLQ